LDHFNRGQMLRLSKDELGDANAARFADGVAQQRVRALATLGRDQIVRRFKEPIVDVVRFDEIDDVDGARLLESSGFEIILRENDKTAFLEFVPFDEIVPRDGVPVTDANALK